LLDFNIHTSRWKILAPLPKDGSRFLTRVSWLREGSALLVEMASSVPSNNIQEVLSFDGHNWISSRQVFRPAVSPERLEVVLRQGMNLPPQIVATEGKAEVALLPPDPALDGVHRNPVTVVHWKDAKGDDEKGGLIVPRQGSSRAPPPLVILAYHFLPDLFLPDGYSPTAFAAQSLAANGFAVIQMDAGSKNPSTEDADFVSKIDAAVAVLSERGLVDRTKVGLVGWSFSAQKAFYAITHPGKVQLAAVIAADGWGGSFADYLLLGESEQDAPLSFGLKKSFWDDKRAWLSRDNSFNMDRVRTPTLISSNLQGDLEGIGDALSSGGIVSAYVKARYFELSGRPIESQIFPSGGHALQRPRERQVSIDTTVDWMSFWLRGEEDALPAKSAQYIRWRAMRVDWRKILARPVRQNSGPSH
jgi:hypothetical protein